MKYFLLLLLLTSFVTCDDDGMTSRHRNRRKLLAIQRAQLQHAERERLRYTTCTTAEEQPQRPVGADHVASRRSKRSIALDVDADVAGGDDVSVLFTESSGIVEFDLSRVTSRLPATNFTIETWLKAEGGQQNPTHIIGELIIT